jgi:hypothetical protein
MENTGVSQPTIVHVIYMVQCCIQCYKVHFPGVFSSSVLCNKLIKEYTLCFIFTANVFLIQKCIC